MNAMLGELPTWNLDRPLFQPDRAPISTPTSSAPRPTPRPSPRTTRARSRRSTARRWARAVARFEALTDLMGRIGSYAQLYYAQDMADPERGRFSQNVSEALTDIGAKLVFFRLELNKLEDADLAAKQKDPALAKYAPVAARPARRSGRTSSPTSSRRRCTRSHVVGRAAWSRLFDETIARLRYPFRNEVLTEPQILDKLSNKDAAVRKDAAKSFGKVQGDNIAIFSLVTNTLAKDKEIEDRWRKYPRPQSAANLANVVEDEVVDALRRGGEGGLSAPGAPLLQAQGQVVRRRHDAVLGPQRAAARARRPHRSRGPRPRRPCSTPTAPSRPSWPMSAGSSSAPAGSTRRRGRASRRAPSPIRRCRRRIPICC